MVLLNIDRVHARYEDVHGQDANRFDRALNELAQSALDAELFDYRAPGAPANAWAVCVEEVQVEFEADASAPAGSIARMWAAAVVNALDRQLQSGQGVVVYRREVDAMVDLARSVRIKDTSRVWAWHQAGMISRRAWPSSADIASLLRARPQLVPAALAALSSEESEAAAWALPLSTSEWLDLAEAVAVTSGVPRRSDARSGTSASAAPAAPEVNPSAMASDLDGDVPAAALRALSVLPPRLTNAMRERATHDELWVMAALILATTTPALVRRPAALAAVSEILASPPLPSSPTSPNLKSRRPHAPSPVAPKPTSSARDDNDRTSAAREPNGEQHRTVESAEPRPGPNGDEPNTVHSNLGGVLFLAHVLADVDLVGRLDPASIDEDGFDGVDPRVLITHVVANVTGCPGDDPAVLVLAGCFAPDDDETVRRLAAVPLLAQSQRRVHRLADEVRDALARRLPPEIEWEPDADVQWLWARSTTIERQRGWIEATYRLHDVDLRIRVAGLDLDPGFVWWLGSVLRFRYV